MFSARCLVVLALGVLSIGGCATLQGGRKGGEACPEGTRADTASCLDTSPAVEDPRAALIASQRCVDPFPHGSVPVPPGTYTNAWSDAMGHQAKVQGEIITRNLWFDGGDQLGPEGLDRIDFIANSLAYDPRLVLVEIEPLAIAADQTYEQASSENEQLNAERGEAVIAALTARGIANAHELVFFTPDRSVGVRGIESPNVFNQQFMGGLGGRRGGRGGLGGGTGGGRGGFGGMMGGGMMGGGMMGGGIF